MRTNFLGTLTAILLAASLGPSVRAQFTGNGQLIAVNGTVVNWPGDYDVGRSNTITQLSTDHDELEIVNAGVLSLAATSNFLVGVLSGTNTVLVTGSGSVLNCLTGSVSVGYSGSSNSLVISDGGAVIDSGALLGVFSGSDFASVLVTGPGSVWSNVQTFANIPTLIIGSLGTHCSLVISNQAMVINGIGYVGGGAPNSDNSVSVVDGGQWVNSQTLYVGYFDRNNTLVIHGGSVLASNAFIGYEDLSGATPINNAIHVSSGSLFVTNAPVKGQLVVSRQGGKGELIIDGGSATVDSLMATNGTNSVITFTSGTLDTKGTAISDGREFVVGDGTKVATYHLTGGQHSFSNGVRVANASFLVACSVAAQQEVDIYGSVVVDPGGTVIADCGGTINFNGGVTNNGTIAAADGTSVYFFGPVVNNGVINAIGGTLQFLSTIENNGTILTPLGTNSWISSSSDKWEVDANWPQGAPSLADPAILITNASSKTVTIDATTSGSFPGTMTISNLTLSAPDGLTNTLFLDNAGTATPLTILGTLVIESNAAVSANNSSVLDSNDLFIGNNGGNAALSITNGGIVYNGYGYVGGVPASSNNNVLITGSGTIWSNRDDVYIGYVGSFNNLVVTNQGTVFSDNGYVGLLTGSSGNQVLVADPGSVWNNSLDLYVGNNGSANNLVISNQAAVYNGYGYVGYQFSGGNNNVLVTGADSVWSNNFDLYVGFAAPGNNLVISNQGMVINGSGYIGEGDLSSHNSVLVTGSGSVWSNSLDLYLGFQGAANSLVISNQAAVYNGNGNLGYFSTGSKNNALITGSGSVWNNSSDLYVGVSGAGNGLVISDQGMVINGNCYMGLGASSSNNHVLVTQLGTVWSNNFDLFIGYNGAANSLIVSNQGTVLCDYGPLGLSPGASNCSVLVSGPGSVWNSGSEVDVGNFASANSLVISNQGSVYSGYGTVGDDPTCSNNVVRVTGPGSVWCNSFEMDVGIFSSHNSLIIANQGSVLASNSFIGYSDPEAGLASNNVIEVDGGSLFVTNAPGDGQLVVGPGGGPASLILNGGSVTVDQLLLTNGVNSLFAFNAGLFNSAGTFVTNSQTFVVGDGTDVATFHLLGGTHSFANHLEISNNATLSGCGTIDGNVVVDPGGLVLADCGGSLTFTGIVTNNGTMRAINDSVLESYGPVVNNGLIDITSGTTNFHSTFVNNGTIVGGSPPPIVLQITGIARQANDIRITWLTTVGTTNALQVTAGGSGGSYSTNGFADIFTVTNVTASVTNYLDVSGATNVPSRYYRVRLVP